MEPRIINWRNREGLINERAWLSEGIKLYRELLNEDPEKIEYKTNMAKLLTRSGTDEKLVYVNLMKAKDLFEEVLLLSPSDAEVFYRLGHIYYEIKKYHRCMAHFEVALEGTLSDIRRIRSYITISKAYYHIGDDGEANDYFQKAVEFDSERNFTEEINEVSSLLTSGEKKDKLVRYADGARFFFSDEEVEEMKIKMKDEAILDLSHFHPTFYGTEDDERLERKEAELLYLLISRDTRYFSKEELIAMIWEGDELDSPQPRSIAPMVSKIKRKLRICLPPDSGDIITNKRGDGYRWTCTTPVNIIKK